MANKVTFSGQKLKDYGLLSEGNVLDLMQVVQSFASSGSKLCHFLHLSVQELLTALKISKLPPPKQVQVFQEMFNNPRFSAVFIFYAAITKLETKGIRDIVARIAQSREKQPLLSLLYCLYEAQDVLLCCFVASQLNGELQLHYMALSPLDCLSLGYFLSCLYRYDGGDFKVQLTESIISSSNCGFLAKGLSTSTLTHAENSSLNNPPPHACVTLELIDDVMRRNGNGFKFLIESFKKNTSVSQLKLYQCNLKISETEDNGPLLMEMLRNNSTLQQFDLSGSNICVSGLGYIAKGLRHNTGLVKLSLDACSVRVTEDNGPLLEEMLRENRTLQELDLSHNPIGASGLGYVAKGLRHNTGLVKLSLDCCSASVSKENGPLLEEMLSKNKSLQKLVLSYNTIGAIGLGYIAKGLKHNTGLVKLSLYWCSVRVTEDNGPLLEKMLRENRTLQELDLSFCPIRASGLGYIAKGLRHNIVLVKLSLYECSVSVTKDNGPLLEEMLSENKSLQELVLSYNTIGASGLGYISKGLKHNTGLVKLSLSWCSVEVTEDNGPLLEEMLRENKTLQELVLMGNRVDSTGLAYIAEGLQHNTTLLSLSLQNGHISITADNGLLLARMLEVNSTMNELDLRINRISTEGLHALGEGLAVNRGLKTVYIPNYDHDWQSFPLKVKQARLEKSLPPLDIST